MPFLIALIVIALILPIIVKSPKVIGWIGEFIVKNTIGKTTKNKQYVINDLILENDGKSSQIDHIVINQHGVWVIETKNYSGRIYGSENQLEWTQVLSYGKVKNKLYNPLKQNATHIYNVKKIIGNFPITSLVVFIRNNTQYIDAPNVIPVKKLRHYLNRGDCVLTDEQMQTIYNLLLENKSNISTSQHIKNINTQQQNLREGVCPRCGGKLVHRVGKHGDFWGCSNYPKCKFVKKK